MVIVIAIIRAIGFKMVRGGISVLIFLSRFRSFRKPVIPSVKTGRMTEKI